MIANFVQNNLLTDENSIRYVVSYHRSFGRWVMDQLNRLKAALGNNDAKTRAFLDKAARLYHEALDESKKRKGNTSGTDLKYSIKHNSNGKEYWCIESDKDIFKNLKTPKEFANAAYDFLLSNRDNRVTVKDKNGKEITFIRLSAEEFTNSKESQYYKKSAPEIFKSKMRMIPSLQDILLHSSVEWHSQDMKTHKLFKQGGFDNYRGKVSIDNVLFNTIVRVGVTDFGNVFYDINLEVDQYLPRAKSVSDINKSTSDNSIPKTEENVNGVQQKNNKNFSVSKANADDLSVRDSKGNENDANVWDEYQKMMQDEYDKRRVLDVSEGGKSVSRGDLSKTDAAYLERVERKMLNRIASSLGVPYRAKRDFLADTVKALSDEFLKTGNISQGTVDKVFEIAENRINTQKNEEIACCAFSSFV